MASDDTSGGDVIPGQGKLDEEYAARLIRMQGEVEHIQTAAHDTTLAGLIDIVESSWRDGSHGIELPVVLSLGGMLVTGRLTASAEWARAMTHFGVEEIDQSESAASLRKLFGVEDRDPDVDRIFDAKPGLKDWERRHVHLREAQFVLGARHMVPASGGLAWRGRLSAVTGWTISSLSAQ